MGSYHWQCRDIRDTRRTSIWGRGKLKLQATGLWLWVGPFPSVPLAEAMRTHPCVLDALKKEAAEVPADPDDPAEKVHPSALNFETKEEGGWRLYYRSKCPELVPTHRYSARIRQK